MKRSAETSEIISLFNEAFQRHDVSILNDLIADHCVMESAAPAPNGMKTVGRSECLAFWGDLIKATDTQFTPEEVIVLSERAVILWRYRWGEGEIDWVRGVTVMTVKDGLITEVLGYVKGHLTNEA